MKILKDLSALKFKLSVCQRHYFESKKDISQENIFETHTTSNGKMKRYA